MTDTTEPTPIPEPPPWQPKIATPPPSFVATISLTRVEVGKEPTHVRTLIVTNASLGINEGYDVTNPNPRGHRINIGITGDPVPDPFEGHKLTRQ